MLQRFASHQRFPCCWHQCMRAAPGMRPWCSWLSRKPSAPLARAQGGLCLSMPTLAAAGACWLAALMGRPRPRCLRPGGGCGRAGRSRWLVGWLGQLRVGPPAACMASSASPRVRMMVCMHTLAWMMGLCVEDAGDGSAVRRAATTAVRAATRAIRAVIRVIRAIRAAIRAASEPSHTTQAPTWACGLPPGSCCGGAALHLCALHLCCA